MVQLHLYQLQLCQKKKKRTELDMDLVDFNYHIFIVVDMFSARVVIS